MVKMKSKIIMDNPSIKEKGQAYTWAHEVERSHLRLKGKKVGTLSLSLSPPSKPRLFLSLEGSKSPHSLSSSLPKWPKLKP